MKQPDPTQTEPREFTGDYHLRLWSEWLPRTPLRPVFCYVLQGDPGTAVKVGYSDDIPTRIARLQTGNPQTLRLLYALPGGFALEQDLHSRLPVGARVRPRADWFDGVAVPSFLAFVEQLADHMVSNYREHGNVANYRRFGGWPPHHRRSGESCVEVSFVDPAELRAV